jgi:hypothetical protein
VAERLARSSRLFHHRTIDDISIPDYEAPAFQLPTYSHKIEMRRSSLARWALTSR